MSKPTIHIYPHWDDELKGKAEIFNERLLAVQEERATLMNAKMSARADMLEGTATEKQIREHAEAENALITLHVRELGVLRGRAGMAILAHKADGEEKLRLKTDMEKREEALRKKYSELSDQNVRQIIQTDDERVLLLTASRAIDSTVQFQDRGQKPDPGAARIEQIRGELEAVL